MKHSQPHITLYRVFVFFSWGGNMLRKVESQMMILSYAYLASFSPPSPGVLAMILCSSLTGTYNNNFETNCGPD